MTGNDEAWENLQTGLSTKIPLRDAGDFNIFQSGADGFTLKGRMVANYDYRPTGLLHLMLFHLQTGMPVPNRDDWNEELFGGNHEETRDYLRDLVIIAEQAKTGKLVRLMAEDQKQIPEGTVAIPQLFDERFILLPAITKEGNFTYVNKYTRKQSILFDQDDVSRAFGAIRDHMLSGERGQRPLVGKIYSEFPFEAYENDE